VLGLVVLMLAAVTVVAMRQAVLVSATTRESGADFAGDECERLADGAVHEAMALLRRRANDARSSTFATLRRPVDYPVQPELDVTPPALPQTAALIDEAPYRLEALSASVVEQGFFDDLVNYERFGHLRVRATVSRALPRGRTVRRTVETVTPYSMALLTLPHPFCHYGLYVDDVSTVTSMPRVDRYRRLLLRCLDEAQRLPSTAPGPLRRLPTRAEAEARAPALPACRDGVLYGLTLWRPARTVDLASLDLARRLDDLYRAVTVELEGLPASADRVVRLVDEALSAIETFGRDFAVVPARLDDGSANPRYLQLQRSRRKFARSYWRPRVQVRVEPPTQGGFEAFRSRYETFRGVLSVANEQGALELRGSWPGRKVLLVGAGGAYLEDFGGNDADEIVTVVVPEGPVTIVGEVRCALVVSAGAAVSFHPGARLVGALVTERLPAGGLRDGAVTGDGRYFWDRTTGSDLFVGISPAVAYRKVART